MTLVYMQDMDRGGISDRADDECDIFHTFFGIAGLSLLGYPGLLAMDPVYALPEAVVQKCRRNAPVPSHTTASSTG